MRVISVTHTAVTTRVLNRLWNSDIFILGSVCIAKDGAGSSAVAMLASQARGRGFKSRPVHFFISATGLGGFEHDFAE